MTERDEVQQEIEAFKRDRFHKSKFGLLVEEWRNSEIGQYVYQRAEQLKETVKHSLAETADFEDPKELYALRMEYQMANQAVRWLEEAVADGQAAFYELQKIESEETLQ